MKSELRKQQLTVTLSDNNYLAHVLFLLVVQFLLCYVWNLRAISEYKPTGLIFGGRFNGGFFLLPVWGAYIWRGLISQFYGM